MVSFVTKKAVYDYIRKNPGSTPAQIADEMNAPVGAVSKRLMKLLYARVIDRKEERRDYNSMYYFPILK